MRDKLSRWTLWTLALAAVCALPATAAGPQAARHPTLAAAGLQSATVALSSGRAVTADDIFHEASACTVTIHCSNTNISCSSASGNCTTSGNGDCVVCDGVSQACCSCADCQANCDTNYYNCSLGCDPPAPASCQNICERVYSRCLAYCPC